MDSLTQAVLGAAVGEAVLGRRAGRRAAAWGAVLGTLPDLDVFVPFGSPVADFTFHRAESHALFWLTLAAPLCAWAITRLHRDQRAEFRGWLLLCWLCLVTHPLLDALTIYGTQLGLPFTNHPFGTGSVFVIDPAFTLPVLAGVLGAVLLRRRPLGHRLNALGLGVGCAYLAFGLAAQAHVAGHVRAELARAGLAADRVLVTPTPFNGVLWRVLAMQPGGYCEGFRSLLDGDAPFAPRCFESRPELLEPVADAWAVERLRWFTKGWYSVRREGDEIVFRDLRMGQEPLYAFTFVVGVVRDGRTVPLVPERQVEVSYRDRARGGFGWLWRRISDPTLPPP